MVGFSSIEPEGVLEQIEACVWLIARSTSISTKGRSKKRALTSDGCSYRRQVCDYNFVQPPLELVSYPQLFLLAQAWIIKAQDMRLIDKRIIVNGQRPSQPGWALITNGSTTRLYLRMTRWHAQLRIVHKGLDSDRHICHKAKLRRGT